MAHDQLCCWSCEEIVHSSAATCPYCNVSLHQAPTFTTTSHPKIAQLVPSEKEVPHAPAARPKPAQKPTSAVLPITFLFAGCNVLFLAVLIALFARGGTFSLTWPASSWPAYFAAGLSLLASGIFTLRRVE